MQTLIGLAKNMRREIKMIRWFLLILFVLPLSSASSWAQIAPNAVHLEDVERQLGPFEIADQKFIIVLHKKRIEGSADADFGETLVGLEIKDAAGKIHYQSNFTYKVEKGRFVEATDASVRLLEGEQAGGLLLTYGVLPSTPLGGESYQVFGLFDKKLVPFSSPIFVEGGIVESEESSKREESIVRTATQPDLQGEVLNSRIWTGNLFVIFPMRVDWMQAKLLPAWRCSKMTINGPTPSCRYSVETDRVQLEEGPTFVRLFPEPEPGFTPAHIVVKENSIVEFSEVECQVSWSEDAEGIGLAVSGDPWLKIRIDGREGWIHTQEDFVAIGLPQAD
jgi:hypothetical protein